MRFDNRGALTIAQRAVRLAEEGDPTDRGQGTDLIDALLTEAMAHQALKNVRGVQETMARVAALAPTYPLDPAQYPPSVVAVFRNAVAVRAQKAEERASVSPNQHRRKVSPLVWGAVGAGMLGGLLGLVMATGGSEAPNTGAVALQFR